MTVVLEARQVTRRYPGGTLGLRAVDLCVEAGETVALVGPSGAGKSTLLRMFNRLDEPTSGTVHIKGQPAAGLDPVALRRRTGYVAQDGGLLPHWTVERNVALVPQLLGAGRAARTGQAHAALELVGLPAPDFASRYPHELSGGQRQRAAVARALAAEPPVVLLDEPFGALDALTRLELQAEFQALRRRVRPTIVLVTHDLREAFRLGDRIAVLRDGVILQTAPPAELQRAPAHAYVRALIDQLAAS